MLRALPASCSRPSAGLARATPRGRRVALALGGAGRSVQPARRASTAPTAPRPSARRDALDTLTSSPSPPSPPSSPPPLPLPRALPPRRALLLVSVPVPPAAWPARLEARSPLLSALGAWAAPREIAVIAEYDGAGSAGDFAAGEGGAGGAGEAYAARLMYADGTAIDLARLALARDGALDGETAAALDAAARHVAAPPAARGVQAAARGRQEVVVCTHGARDCRCADRGGPLVDALRAEVARRGLDVRVGEVAHVGGHKYAANALVLPSLDMLSNLSAAHAPRVVDHALGARGLWAHWRGRLGLGEAAQAAVWAEVGVGAVDEAAASAAGAAGEGSAAAPEPAPAASPAAASANAQTVRLVFRTFEGERREVEAAPGQSLLEVGKAAGLPALEGVCGGHLECATCHLYITAPLPPPSEDEQDMLGYALGFKDGQSRLGCQVRVDGRLAAWAAAGGEIGLPQF